MVMPHTCRRIFTTPLALASAASLVTALGCASAQSARKVEVPELHVVATPVGPDALEVYDAEALFVRGLDLLDGGAYADAADYFERLVREFPNDRRAPLAHYDRGIAYIHLLRGDEAVHAFDMYLKLLPENASDKDRLDGRFKRGQALAVAKRYDEVATVFDEILGEDLSTEDHIEALVDAGVGHYMLGINDKDGPHRPTAESRFLEARRLYRAASERARLDVAFFVAQSAFYLAELARLEFSEYKLRFPSQDDLKQAQAAGGKSPDAPQALEGMLGEQLEEKCQKLLRAQYAYLRTIREEHPGWASAAGYNVGQMYEELHDELVHLPAPADLTDEQRALYLKLVRKKVMILLEKAQRTWGATSEMVTRTGADGEWAEKTRASLARIQDKLRAEQLATDDVDNDGNDVAASAPATPGAS